LVEPTSTPELEVAQVEQSTKPKRSFNLRILIITGAMLAAGYSGWQYLKPQSVAKFIQVSGRIEVDETDIAAKTGGRITKVLVQEGEQVSAGQIVIEIEDLEVNEQLNSAMAQVNSVQQEAVQAKIDMAVAESRIQEAVANLEQSKADSKGRVNQANSLVLAAAAQIEQAQAQVEEAQAQIRQAKAQVGETQAQIKQAKAQVGEAQAQIKQAKAEWQFAQKSSDRYSQLARDGVISFQQFDQARSAAETARAKLDQAKSAAETARAKFDQTKSASGTAQAKFDQASATFAVRVAAIKTANAQSTAAQGGLTQNQSTQLNPIIRNSQLAVYQQQKQQAYAKFMSAQAKVQNAVANKQQIQKRIDSFQVRSPLAGIVQSRNVEPGAVVATGRTLLTMIDPKAVHMRAYIPEGDLSKIHVGQMARVLLDSDIPHSLTAKVNMIDQKASFTPENIYFKKDRVRQVFGIKLTINQEQNYAKPGMPAEAEIDLK
jgi:HlyD family secretion protein